MAGHSQWANRKHRKQRQDKKKGKIFSKMARKITIAAREGGGDPETNPTLRMLIDKARSFEVPNENIERAIKRGTGELEGVEYSEFSYEGYGPGGVALLLDIVTDNRNRSASEIRHIFANHDGNLAESGSVAWMFERKGYLAVSRDVDIDEEEIFLLAADAGAEEVNTDSDLIEITTPDREFHSIKQKLEQQGLMFEVEELTMVPQTLVPVEGRDARKLLRLLDELEDHDDIQDIYGNFDIPEEELVEYTA